MLCHILNSWQYKDLNPAASFSAQSAPARHMSGLLDGKTHR